jgi:acetylornithine deacetylase
MDTLQWLRRLIGFNSISSQSNMPIIDAIDAWFKEQRIDTQIIHGQDPAKANIFATIPASNGQTQGGLILSGHTDVVPIAGQMWDTDPFIATEKNGNIYGRGACDMKGFIAVMLAMVPELKKLKLLRPIHFSFSYDEEVGCIGVEYVLEHLKEIGIHPGGCVVGEPSGLKPIIGEKGRQVYHCQIQGFPAHSSLINRGCNAIEYASQLISYIKKLGERIQKQGPFNFDFDLPFTTITTTIVSGGIASNVIPGTCEFIYEVRYLPDFPVENLRKQVENYFRTRLLPSMKKVYPDADIYLVLTSDENAFNSKDDAEITEIVRRVTGSDERIKVSYSTEAGLFDDEHIPTIICGPGNIEQAHQPNEFISCHQLNLCEEVFRDIIHSFCAKEPT